MGSSEPSFTHIGRRRRPDTHDHKHIRGNMLIQYGHVLTFLAFVVAGCYSSSVEDVLAGMSNSQIEDILNSMGTPLDYPMYGGYGNNHDYDYDTLANEAEVPKDVNIREDVAKPEPSVSQGQQQQSGSIPIHANPMLPAYCDPPNPCPIGYTSSDGCLEDFENTSEYSRKFQATQRCICDTEHMFDCPDENPHRSAEDIAAVNILANIPGLETRSGDEDNNPYLDGQKLPVAAKKGHF